MNIEHESRLKKMSAPQSVPASQLRVVIVARTQDACAELKASLASLEGVNFEALPALGKLPATLQASRYQSLVLLVDVDPGLPDDLRLLRELRNVAGAERAAVVALTERGSENLALRAMRAGADDVLMKPIDLSEAREVFARVLERGRFPSPLPDTNARSIVFMHLSGGVGATTLAVNAACLLATASKSVRTCLLDLDLQFGSAATLVDLPAASPIQDLIDDPQRLDGQMLDGMMLQHPTGLRVLTAPRMLLPIHAYENEVVRALIASAKEQFGYVVLDLPVALAPWTDAVLRSAFVIYLVASQTVSSAHRIVKFSELLHDEGLTQLPLKMVINRFHRGRDRGSEVSLQQFEKAIGRKVDHLIPNDYSLISASHGQGKPAVLVKPNSAFSIALRKMLSDDLGKDIFVQRGRWFSWLRRS